MIFILLTVAANALIFIIFKLFDRYKINTFQAITINYLVAFGVAVYASDTPLSIGTLGHAKWLWSALILGAMFIGGFYLVALTAQRLGMSVVAISSKMSLAIPVVFGILAYNESVGLVKIAGIILALLAVYLSSYSDTGLPHKANLFLPLALFLVSGALDTTLKYIQVNYIPNGQTSLFLSIVFLLAGVIGTIVLTLGRRANWSLRNISAGVLLGVVNYFSLFFLLNALQSNGIESATVFTINNVSIVMLSSLIGILAFKEKLLPINLLGLGLAVISIATIAASNNPL